jgi:hypothetical protein
MAHDEQDTAPAVQTEKNSGLATISAIASATGLIVTILTNVNKTIDEFNAHFYVPLVALTIVTIIFAWKALKPPRVHRSLRISVIAFTVLVFAGAMGWQAWKYYDYHCRKTQPATPPNVVLPSLILFPTVHAAEKVLQVDAFQINQDLSSFQELQDHLFGNGPLVKSFQLNMGTLRAFESGQCASPFGNKPAQAAVPVLKEFWAKHGRSDLSAYLTDKDSLGRLIRERGDIFDQLMPTPAQVSSMSKDDYEIFKQWVQACVGMYNPVFTVAIRNNSKKDVVLNNAVYHVLKIGTVAGGTGSLLYPLHTYDYVLPWELGNHTQNLNSPLVSIPAGGEVSFNIRLTPDRPDHGITWWMFIEFTDSQGDSAQTENFELTMNKQVQQHY